MVELSAGILLTRRAPGLEVFLAHMGGPFWAGKDAAAWSIPKGIYTDEPPLTAALREFAEEIGAPAPPADYAQLGEFRLPSGKRLTVFTAEGEAAFVASNTFEVEWPPRSGQLRSFPEVDRAEWFPLDVAREKITKGQLQVLEAIGHD
ncbi:MAG: DNA mismatch repair protein MutT [Micrococcales bacterium 70-64]|nr:NUDIX domain-containing protein [Leifsonia sp.]ODU64691.1 MAG: DNA mismatch repair protein MutT [Leifsonia sp. SCN 70-46]OJX86382.1 MAG: DNA mismatch repair protein MutT [Micrococcales bacterium 70-64]